ncbi:hypothetical protein CPB84DRAFT_1853849 [Gymnopilus junonius]|uniref:Uncharacterized protein n=1 Tax=Gymnopilus junonius TaxID=109634 RepID=A0A9P5TG82_GYMJU|nr:hypothetical protein CPB84DRAFT_1853849 [Gymnopilus junonius]
MSSPVALSHQPKGLALYFYEWHASHDQGLQLTISCRCDFATTSNLSYYALPDLQNKLAKLEAEKATEDAKAGAGMDATNAESIAEILPTLLFDDNNSMMHINASKYSEKHSISRLTGAPPANTKIVAATAEITQVATISTNDDTYVRNLITQAMEKVGKEGDITIKEGRTVEDEIEITEGMHFD